MKYFMNFAMTNAEVLTKFSWVTGLWANRIRLLSQRTNQIWGRSHGVAGRGTASEEKTIRLCHLDDLNMSQKTEDIPEGNTFTQTRKR